MPIVSRSSKYEVSWSHGNVFTNPFVLSVARHRFWVKPFIFLLCNMFTRRKHKKSNTFNSTRNSTSSSIEEPHSVTPSNTIEVLPTKDKDAQPTKTNCKNELVLQERQNSNHDTLNKQFETLTLYNLNNNADVTNIPTFHPRTLSTKELPKIVSRRCSTVTNEYKPIDFQTMPIEIKLWIFSFLESTELAAVSCVCKDWNILSKERHLWIGKRRGGW